MFLPCQYLEEITDLADSWQVENQQGRLRPLGKHRGFVVRALERISDRPTQVVLKKNWQRLEECVQNNDACEKFHLQADCPNIGDLEDVRHVPGLKLVAELPSEESDRQEIFYDIINAAVPIALWFGQDNTQTPDQRIMELDQLLQDRQLTNFADLAQHWKQKRATAHIRLLCDRPDRRPNLPDPTQEEDLLVAS